MENIEARLFNLIESTQSVDPGTVRIDSTLGESLGLDSLELIDLLLQIDNEFGIRIPPEAGVELRTVGDIVKYLEKQWV